MLNSLSELEVLELHYSNLKKIPIKPSNAWQVGFADSLLGRNKFINEAMEAGTALHARIEADHSGIKLPISNRIAKEVAFNFRIDTLPAFKELADLNFHLPIYYAGRIDLVDFDLHRIRDWKRTAKISDFDKMQGYMYQFACLMTFPDEIINKFTLVSINDDLEVLNEWVLHLNFGTCQLAINNIITKTKILIEEWRKPYSYFENN